MMLPKSLAALIRFRGQCKAVFARLAHTRHRSRRGRRGAKRLSATNWVQVLWRFGRNADG